MVRAIIHTIRVTGQYQIYCVLCQGWKLPVSREWLETKWFDGGAVGGWLFTFQFLSQFSLSLYLWTFLITGKMTTIQWEMAMEAKFSAV